MILRQISFSLICALPQLIVLLLIPKTDNRKVHDYLTILFSLVISLTFLSSDAFIKGLSSIGLLMIGLILGIYFKKKVIAVYCLICLLLIATGLFYMTYVIPTDA